MTIKPTIIDYYVCFIIGSVIFRGRLSVGTAMNYVKQAVKENGLMETKFKDIG